MYYIVPFNKQNNAENPATKTQHSHYLGKSTYEWHIKVWKQKALSLILQKSVAFRLFSSIRDTILYIPAEWITFDWVQGVSGLHTLKNSTWYHLGFKWVIQIL